MKRRVPEPSHESLLSPQRAFVLQFYPRVDVAEGVLVGRAEHVVSGRSARFDSLAELLAFLAKVLAEQTRPFDDSKEIKRIHQ